MSAWTPTCPPRKAIAARVLALTPTTRVRRLHETRWPILRIFNFHSVPDRYAHRFEELLERLAARFTFALPEQLERLISDGPGRRSQAILTFDDALANHVEVAAPIVERLGTRAVFCVPAGFPDVHPGRQAAWFRAHVYPVPTELHGTDDVRPASWHQLGAVAERGHRICSHGLLHTVISKTTPPDLVRREVVHSRVLLEDRLPGVKIDGFCWPGVPAPDAHHAARAIRATYRFSLGNDVRALRGGDDLYNIPRINLEASWTPDVVDLQLSGVLHARALLRRSFS